MRDCIENGGDASVYAKYMNYGIHGAGIATAVDSLINIKKYIYETGEISKEDLLGAIQTNFENHPDMLYKLRHASPKMGNNNDEVDPIAVQLMDYFAEAVKDKKNDKGGIFRVGTGSAMYYIWYSSHLLTTPDGRKDGEGLPTNYSPSLFARCNGPVSIIKSFTKPNLKKVINGGPLTLELHDSMFRTAEGIKKTAYLVKSFVDLGGHQLQLNTVNKEKLLQAQKSPQQYRNLIVRVWGWSGYFVELDKEYQEHIIQRMELIY